MAPSPSTEPGSPASDTVPLTLTRANERPRDVRWESEAAFFDALARTQAESTRPVPESVLSRYGAEQARRIYGKEYAFRVLGDLHGKSVLDVGCGEGSNAMLLAKKGARVTGVDISPASIELCRKKAELNGVADRTEFRCSPLELLDFKPDSFDVIWGDGILHHVVPELAVLMPKLVQWAKPSAQVMFSEPVSMAPWMRALRLKLPIHANATPDERPLTPEQLEFVCSFLTDVQRRPFYFLGRARNLMLRGTTYETATAARRVAVDALHLADYALLSVPLFSQLGGMWVISGRMPAKK